MPAAIMTDVELMESFEDMSLADDSFHHLEHVRLAFLYLCRFPLLEALEKFSSALHRFAASRGKPERYHQTITWAYVFLVQERKSETQDWDGFAAANPDLMDWGNSILKKYYREETLQSEKAREMFVLPDQARG